MIHAIYIGATAANSPNVIWIPHVTSAFASEGARNAGLIYSAATAAWQYSCFSASRVFKVFRKLKIMFYGIGYVYWHDTFFTIMSMIVQTIKIVGYIETDPVNRGYFKNYFFLSDDLAYDDPGAFERIYKAFDEGK